jgi:hypothetical protein
MCMNVYNEEKLIKCGFGKEMGGGGGEGRRKCIWERKKETGAVYRKKEAKIARDKRKR